MKMFVFFICSLFLMTGCCTAVKAVPARNGKIVVVKERRHRVPRRTIVLVGSRVKARPARSTVIYFNNVLYLFADGVYYKSVDQEYEVIKPQIGMIVPALPEDGVKEMKIKDEVFYSYGDVLYKKVVTKDGIKFEVQGFIDK